MTVKPRAKDALDRGNHRLENEGTYQFLIQCAKELRETFAPLGASALLDAFGHLDVSALLVVSTLPDVLSLLL